MQYTWLWIYRDLSCALDTIPVYATHQLPVALLMQKEELMNKRVEALRKKWNCKAENFEARTEWL